MKTKIFLIFLAIILLIGIIPNFVSATIYYNKSDGFSTTNGGSGVPAGITTNGSDFWVVDNTASFVYHFNKTGGNITDGFSASALGSTSTRNIATNGSDFWIVDFTDAFVYHTNKSGFNFSDGFSTTSFGSAQPYGITTNGSDFWIADWGKSFVFHVNKTGGNITNGFSQTYINSGNLNGITTNKSDFWLTDQNSYVVHYNSTGNISSSDILDVNALGLSQPKGITTNVSLIGGTLTDFWIADGVDQFVYHFSSNIPDIIPPTITNPRNFTQLVNLPFSQDMSATDPSGIGYYWLNDTTTFNISQSGIITNIASLTVNTYWLNYSVNDTLGNQVSLIFNINLTAVPPPPTQKQVFCSTSTSGFSGFYSQFPTIFIAIGLLVLVGVLFVIVAVINGKENGTDVGINTDFFSGIDLRLVFVGILGLALVMFVIITILGALCN